ncbi:MULTISPECIES: hypothetical protein [unclassified Streptomyces]|uniref:hypothetical protein n=1 Tax=unclassified Streptomyces TaxID=2593676 RepID=UPI00081E2EEA|nr:MULTISPECIES: hypothetical protein [unclassified Streptomyces]MYZ39536.1 hypothetical protein [Streptomyces sp. SID4917]SCG04181.1 hypothetical protein GA0115259_108752 [Streptomyces sp. MnatMP-M17]
MISKVRVADRTDGTERPDRTRLPPSPPPPHLRSWPDRDALLADRAAAMAALTGRRLGIGRLVLLWLTGAVAALGWASVGLAIQSFEQGGLGQLTGLVALALGAVLLIPAGVALGFWLDRGRTVRERLEAWAELDRDPVSDVRVRAHGRSVMWLLLSVALCVAGLWATGAAWAGMAPGPESVTVGETVYALGLAVTVLATGILGAVQSYGHQAWSGRLLSPIPVRRRGGVHR